MESSSETTLSERPFLEPKVRSVSAAFLWKERFFGAKCIWDALKKHNHSAPCSKPFIWSKVWCVAYVASKLARQHRKIHGTTATAADPKFDRFFQCSRCKFNTQVGVFWHVTQPYFALQEVTQKLVEKKVSKPCTFLSNMWRLEKKNHPMAWYGRNHHLWKAVLSCEKYFLHKSLHQALIKLIFFKLGKIQSKNVKPFGIVLRLQPFDFVLILLLFCANCKLTTKKTDVQK